MDFILLGIAALFFAATIGLMRLCERLMNDKARSMR
jgi:hypothetical protein